MTRLEAGFEWLILGIAGAVLAWLLLVPPFIGIADNGDFSKVAGVFCLRGESGADDYFRYFQPSFGRRAEYCWWPGVISAEIGVAATAIGLANMAGDGRQFDLRWLGALHSTLYLLAFGVALRATRPWPIIWRLLFAGLLCFCFLDVCYTAYFNSFYSDAVAIAGFALFSAAAASMLAGRATPAGLALFTLGMVLFAGSKAQHAMLAPAGAVFLFWWFRRRPLRLAATTAGVLILAVSVFAIATTPKWYRGQALFNAVFFRVAPGSPQPVETLRELNLDRSFLPFVGMHAFMPRSPALDAGWTARFEDRVGHGRLALYYLRHPMLAIRDADLALRTLAPMIRPVNLSNFRQVDGQPPGSLTQRMSLWSNWRSGWLKRWPHAFAALFGVCWLGLAAGGWRVRSGYPGRLALLAAAILSGAAIEFGVAALADACETYRHLLLFHLMTDTALVIGLAAAGIAICRRSDRSHGNRPVST